ncbi:putative endonuclease [Arcticibacter svalbardensis MN12-7]|uniref:Endonuclease n=1 Tax=Arcticibacter svalbardensis MN12-7 TaxID=1150600 RepID=R9GU97_9SPHI|nr:DNA/RNA non-specific endonuclease [Arcticibacter svalbardensis]EOR95095.1 putative endonuclease [Arcticibacter svalbardensis MN12-7]
MKKFYALLCAILITSIVTYSKSERINLSARKAVISEDNSLKFPKNNRLDISKSATIRKLEIPKLKPNEYVITHAAYSLSYNEQNEQANWVAYELTSKETNSIYERTNKFIVDLLVKTGSADNQDYLKSGYDRGHLAPAGDMGWSSTAIRESFYYSNMSPQNPSFNRGVWKRAEELVRSWAVDYKSVYIVTGPVLTKGLQTIGSDKVAVPNFFYKVILDNNAPGIKGIGFIIPNKGSSESLLNYAVSIDQVERITGIDFFPLLPDKQEELIESNLNTTAWIWKSSSTSSSSKSVSKRRVSSAQQKTNRIATSVQCSGTTKKGLRCRNKTKNSNGKCYLH